jgi:hypothetical protein
MVLKLPRGPEREFIVIYGIVAIYVATLPSGNSLVGLSRDLLHSVLAIRRRFHGGHISCAYWVKDKTEARLIVRQVNADLAFLQADAKTSQRRIENVAAHMGIALTDNETVLMRARSAVGYVEQQIAQAQAAGELSWFNQAYRAWRLEAKQHGRSMSYAQARARLRRNLFRDILYHPVTNELFPPLQTLNLG